MSVLEDCMRDDLNARAPRAHRGARPGQARDRQLSGGRRARTASRRTTRSSPSGASARCRSRASSGSSATTISEASAQGLFPALRRAPRCGLRYALHRPLHRRRQETPTATSPTVHCTYDPATRAGPRAPTRARSKGNIHWLSGVARGAGRGAALRSTVRGAVSRGAQSRRRARRRRRAESRARTRRSSPATTTTRQAEAGRARLARRSQSGVEAR